MYTTRENHTRAYELQDNSDAQYASFRDNIPYMAIVLVVHPLLRKLYNRFYSVNTTSPQGNGHASKTSVPKSNEADHRMNRRTSYDLYFALVFLTALHGVSVVKILLILYVNFCIASRLPKTWISPTTWIFNVGILFANELTHGYPFGTLVSKAMPFSESAIASAEALDSYGGLIPRWEVLFKMTILRLISFNQDYYWSLDLRAGSPIEVRTTTSTEEI